MVPITSQLKPRYWSHRMILDFLVSLGTSWPRSHCFEAWTNKRSIESFDMPWLDPRNPSAFSPSWKTNCIAFSASTSLTPLLERAWFKGGKILLNKLRKKERQIYAKSFSKIAMTSRQNQNRSHMIYYHTTKEKVNESQLLAYLLDPPWSPARGRPSGVTKILRIQAIIDQPSAKIKRIKLSQNINDFYSACSWELELHNSLM